MRKMRLLFILFLISVSATDALCQNLRRAYLIFTFEDTHKVSQHGKKTYYWIQEVDSLKKENQILGALFLSGFSQNNVSDCCDGKNINPFSVAENTSYRFDNKHYLTLDTLKALINKHRKKIQTIHKIWVSGQQEDVNVFVTPIFGDFCSSNFLRAGLYADNYNGRVYIPRSKFSYANYFWQDEKSKILLKKDFSAFIFYSLPSSNLY